ncbi:MAG: ABC transporter substrate-binding protein [Pseudomonadota bacterium]
MKISSFFILFLYVLVGAPTHAHAIKQLRLSFPVAETGFDPAKVHDAYSGAVVEALFERLVSYDYRARPLKISACTAQNFTRSADALTYTFVLKKGIYFSPDPAFKNRSRELTAKDYVYSIQRLIDPATRSPWQFLIEGKIKGLDAKAKAVTPQHAFNYDAPVAGLRATDPYTLMITLTRPDPNFLSILAMPALSVVAREVIETYPDSNAHPIGTGAFALKKWQRSARIVLGKNPAYQSKENANSTRPPISIDEVDIQIIEESQARWLAFKQGLLDMISLPSDLVPKALVGEKLAEDLMKEGITLQRSIDPEITYTYFNMRDPIVGGMSPEKIALRRALVMAHNTQIDIDVLQKGQAKEATSIIPEGIPGFSASDMPTIRYNPDLANQLLDHYGYKRDNQGWRTLPDGSPLIIKLSSTPDSKSRIYDEFWTRTARQLSIRLSIVKAKFPDLLKAEKECKLQMRGAAWIADYADGDNFMMLLYSKNIHQSNNACFKDSLYDQWYEESQQMSDSPQRTMLYKRMNARMEYLAPWKLGVSRYRNSLIHRRVKGFQQHSLIRADWMYLDLEN